MVAIPTHFFLANNSKFLKEGSKEKTFPVLDIFVKVAAHVVRGGNLEVIGKGIQQIKFICYK